MAIFKKQGKYTKIHSGIN